MSKERFLYYSLNQYLQDTFGCKVYKIAVNAGFTCPNRDGMLDTAGCIFCSAGGSGDFAESPEEFRVLLMKTAAGVSAQIGSILAFA